MTATANRFCDRCGQALVVAGATTPARKPAVALSPWLALIPVIAIILIVAYLLTRPGPPPIVGELPPDDTPTSTTAPGTLSTESPLTATPTPTISFTPTPSSTPTPTIIPTDTPTPTTTTMPPGSITAIYNDQGRLNLRMGPGLNYPILARTEAGARFSVLGRTEDGGWLSAQTTEGTTVWFASTVVELDYPVMAALAIETPQPPVRWLVADSVADFGPVQGDKNWFYTASKSPGRLEWDEMPWDRQTDKWYRWCCTPGRSVEMRFSDAGSFPSRQSDVMRLWVSYYEGLIDIEGWVAKESGAGRGGNGVSLRIVLRRGDAAGQPTIVQELWSSRLGGYDTTGFSYRIPSVQVQPRDAIYFITSANGNDAADNTIFTAQITLVNPGGFVVSIPPTNTPISPKPAPPPSAKLCFEPQLRHYDRSHGGAGEMVGYVYLANGAGFTQGVIRIKGPSGPDQWSHDFPLTGDGGYEATLLIIHGAPPFAYTAQVVGSGVGRSGVWTLDYPNGEARRAAVDWYQIPCP